MGKITPKNRCADEPISPELCLVDPELAATLRAQVAEPGPEEPATEPDLPVLRSPDPARTRWRSKVAPLRIERPSRTRVRVARARRPLLRVVVGGAALIACIPFVPSTQVRAAGSDAERAKASSAAATEQPVLVVPNVCDFAYVFAKGALQDSGFAWRVNGPVLGYAGNRVMSQIPAPGTIVVDTGAPLVELQLERSSGYIPAGKPDGAAPYASTPVTMPAISDSRLAAVLSRARNAPVLGRCERGASPIESQPHGL